MQKCDGHLYILASARLLDTHCTIFQREEDVAAALRALSGQAMRCVGLHEVGGEASVRRRGAIVEDAKVRDLRRMREHTKTLR